MIKLQLQPTDRMLDQFSWVALFMFPAIGWYLAYRYGLPLAWAWTLAGIGFATFFVQVVLLSFLEGAAARLLQALVPKLVFQVLSIVTIPIGFVVSHVLIAAIYYLVFTPMGLFFKLVGRDAMHRKLDPKAASYWHVRGPQRPAASYFKQY